MILSVRSNINFIFFKVGKVTTEYNAGLFLNKEARKLAMRLSKEQTTIRTKTKQLNVSPLNNEIHQFLYEVLTYLVRCILTSVKTSAVHCCCEITVQSHCISCTGLLCGRITLKEMLWA